MKGSGYAYQSYAERRTESAHTLLNKSVNKVTLSVNPEQRAAVKIYRKANFVVTGRAENAPQVDRRFYSLLFMEKSLKGVCARIAPTE